MKTQAKITAGANPTGRSAATGPWTRHASWFIAALLWLATVALYWPVTHHDFLDYDDDRYVTANALVQHGLALDTLKWVFLNPVCSNWHPVTMLSHLLDCQWYGLDPGKHHLTSLLFHACNTVLVFILFRRLTGALWRSACVAALFAWHPLHVESVAWIAERKDVLSAFFGLLSLLAYTRFAQTRPMPSPGSVPIPRPFYRSSFYWLAWTFLALGLLSKPMLVTWPCLFLLLDYWPLQRWQPAPAGETPSFPAAPTTLGRLWLEKIPFFALAAAVCVLTFMVQKVTGAMHALAQVPASLRCENALISWCRYMGKTLWPADLSVFYPYPSHWPLAWVLLAALFLGAVSVLCWLARRRQPFLLVGWCWFVGTLVPVIGVVQVGAQAMADRYTYLPSLGLFLALVWGGFAWSRGARGRTITVSAALAVALISCGAATQRQIACWQNSRTLFQHALAIVPDNDTVRNNLGSGFAMEGHREAAIEQFRAAIRLQPDCVEAYNNLGRMLFETGDTNGAIANYQKAIALEPDFSSAHYNLGEALAGRGQSSEAITQLNETIRLQPDAFKAHNDLAILLSGRGQTNEADREFQLSLWLQPKNANAHFNYGNFLARSGNLKDAIIELQQATRLDANDTDAHRTLASLLAKTGQPDAASREYAEVVRLDTNDADSFYRLGNLQARAGRLDEAELLFQQAIRARPDFAEAHNNLGSLLSAQGRLPNAIAQFREAARNRPDFRDAHYNLGNALLKNEQLDEAATEYQTVIGLAPDFAPAHFYLGVALERKHQTGEALRQFEEAARLRPNDAAAHDKLGELLASLGQRDEAVIQFQTALHYQPNDTEASNYLIHLRLDGGSPTNR
jgi:tetratricopeptide (TPR) repeat protein